MDPLQPESLYQSPPAYPHLHQQLPPPDHRVPSTRPMSKSSSQRLEAGGTKDSTAARKIQKADREKLRRDRLNEQFAELGNTLDPDRPKNDKATILTDTVQLLKDLVSQVEKLKAEYATLTEESRELIREKNDLREEKGSLKSDIENLNIQYQQRMRAMYPWGAMDHSVVMTPSYSYPLPMAMPPGSIPMHPSLQPYPFFGNQAPTVVHNPCSTFVPYVATNTLVDQQSVQHVSSAAQPLGQSHNPGKQDSKDKSSGESKTEKGEGSNDITTDLELKTPGSTADQDSSSGHRKSKGFKRKDNSPTEGSSSTRCSSSCSIQDSSSNSIVGGARADDLDQ